MSPQNYIALKSRSYLICKILDELSDSRCSPILLYGMEGSGKTTLVQEVLREACKHELFEDVVMGRRVIGKPDLQSFQQQIAETLDMEFKDNATIPERGHQICERLKDRKALIVLEDVWRITDLEALGVPDLAICKVLLTSSNEKLLSNGTRSLVKFRIALLDVNESWRLFQSMAGGQNFRDSQKQDIASKVARECEGSPLLIVWVAKFLRRSDLPELYDASQHMVKKFKNKKLSKQALFAVDWRYNKMYIENLKVLFLLCGVIAEKNFSGSGDDMFRFSFCFDDLLKYGVGLNLLKKRGLNRLKKRGSVGGSVEEARDELLIHLRKLVDSSLLLGYEDHLHVKQLEMPDLVHDVAIHYASKDRHMLSLDGDKFFEWPGTYSFAKYSVISSNSVDIPALPEVLECQELEMFRLVIVDKNSSFRIPTNFFEKTRKLKVLDYKFSQTPLPSLRFLKSLQTLCLDGSLVEVEDLALIGELNTLQVLSFASCSIKQLPKEIGNLTHLIVLDLDNCQELKVISPNVLSSLTRLEDLRMRNVFLKWETDDVVGKERSNACLSELKLLPLNALEVEIPDLSLLPEDLFSDKLQRFRIRICCGWSTRFITSDTFTHQEERIVYFDGSHQDCTDMPDARANRDTTFVIRIKGLFANLSILVLQHCNLEFMFSSSTARLIRLKHLKIKNCEKMKELISMEEYGDELTDGVITVFPLLQFLELEGLPNLVTFCSRTCNFPSLETLQIEQCATMDTFIICPLSKITVIDNEVQGALPGDFETAVNCLLIDENVRLPKLKNLYVNGMRTAWKYRYAPKVFCTFGDIRVHLCGGFMALENYITSLIVHRCHGLKFLLSFSMARSLVHLRILNISECQFIEDIVLPGEDDEEEGDADMFHNLEQLKLNDLPNLARFCSGSYFNFMSLRKLQLETCHKLETFIFKHLSNTTVNYKEIEDEDRNDRFKTVAPSHLFDQKVEFPMLETLIINDLPNIREIWGSQLATKSFCKLKDITVQHCISLKYIFTGSVAAIVKWSLEKLIVENCGIVEEIVSGEQGVPHHYQIVFRKLLCMEFKSLPHLTIDSKMLHFQWPSEMQKFGWPQLKRLVLLGCAKVQIFDAKESRFQGTVDIQIPKTTTFPKLEDLTIGPMNIWYGTPILLGLHKQSIFYGVAYGCTPHLKALRLLAYGMEKFTPLLQVYPEPADQIFTELETLELKFCGLNNLELSTISFENLTSLEVTFCWRLQYLMTYSVAKGLKLLERLVVDECKMMKEIVASEKDEDDQIAASGRGADDASRNYEILFGKLDCLELTDLTSLERFCSRKYNVKVPSLNTLKVNWCPFELSVSSDKVLEEVWSNKRTYLRQSHSNKKKALDTTVWACSSERPRDSHEFASESQKIDHTEVVEPNQKKIATNTLEDLQEDDLGIAETHTEHHNLFVTKGKQHHLETDSWCLSRIDAEIKRLQELRTKEEERIDKEKRLADERNPL